MAPNVPTLSLTNLLASAAATGNMQITVEKASNGIIVNIYSNLYDPSNPGQPPANANANAKFVYSGDAATIKSNVNTDLGLGDFLT